MMRALSHIGLSLAVILAPALCCCNLRWMAAASESTHAPTCPPVPKSATCCQKSCCYDADAAEPVAVPATPPKTPSPSCCCTADRPVAADTAQKPDVPAPEFTGEVLTLTHTPALAPEHARLASGLDPPERAGVDARSAALFERHLMRC